MQIKNNYGIAWRLFDEHKKKLNEDQGVYNGDSGFVQFIDEENKSLVVRYDESKDEQYKLVSYEYQQLEELELSYAITVHKSQGSEYKVVVLPAYYGPPMLMSRNLLYTAITRAKELCVVVGIPDALCRMVDNGMVAKRFSGLMKKIIECKEGYVI
jgi:exodeoxyribonuclease V alpha subunit